MPGFVTDNRLLQIIEHVVKNDKNLQGVSAYFDLGTKLQDEWIAFIQKFSKVKINLDLSKAKYEDVLNFLKNSNLAKAAKPLKQLVKKLITVIDAFLQTIDPISSKTFGEIILEQLYPKSVGNADMYVTHMNALRENFANDIIQNFIATNITNPVARIYLEAHTKNLIKGYRPYQYSPSPYQQNLAHILEQNTTPFLKWWDSQVEHLAQEVSLKVPSVSIHDWNISLQAFAENASAKFIASTQGRADFPSQEIPPGLFEPLASQQLARTKKQLDSIEKVTSCWRYDSNHSLQENLIHYLSQRQFLNLVKTKSTYDRPFENLPHFMAANTAELFPISTQTYTAFDILLGKWFEWYNEFIETEHVKQIIKQEETSDYVVSAFNTADIELLDPNKKYGEYFSFCIKQIDELLFKVNSATSLTFIEELARTLYGVSENIGDRVKQLEMLRKSYISHFMQDLTERAQPAEYRLLVEKQLKTSLTENEQKQLLFYQYRYDYLVKLTAHYANAADGEALDKIRVITAKSQQVHTQPNLEDTKIGIDTVVEKVLDKYFKTRPLKSVNDIQNLSYELENLDYYLFESQENKFRIHREMDAYLTAPKNIPLFQLYGHHEKIFYEKIVQGFIKRLSESYVGELTKSDVEKTLKNIHKLNQGRIAKKETDQRHQFALKLEQLFTEAVKNPTLRYLNKHYGLLQTIRGLIFDDLKFFFSHKNLGRHSDAEYNELKARIVEKVEKKVAEILSMHQLKPKTTSNLIKTYHEYKYKIANLIGTAKVSEAKKYDFEHHCLQLQTNISEVLATPPRAMSLAF